MDTRMKNMAGVVTGAAAGIGRGIALTLAVEGAAVVVSDLPSSRQAGEETVKKIRSAGGRAEFFPADVSSPKDMDALVAFCVETYGRLDYAVNNAGIAVVKPLGDVSDEEYDRVVNVNLRGTFNGIRSQLRHMTKVKGGSIVNIASVAGQVAVRDIGVYTATKHAVLGLTKSTAKEYGSQGIRVNAICPNAIRTPLLEGAPKEFQESLIAPQALKRFGEPEEVGHATAFLLSGRAAFITGAILAVDGGSLTGPG